MTWSVTRKASQSEIDAVRHAAERFCRRHGIDTEFIPAESAIECEIDPGQSASATATERARRLRPLWRAILKRVTGSPDGIAYGCVGRSVR